MHFDPVTRKLKKVKLSADSNVQPVLCPDPGDNKRTVKHFNPRTGKLQTVIFPAVSDVQLSADSNVQPVLCPDPVDNELPVKHFNPTTGKLQTVKVPAVTDVQPVLCPDQDVLVSNNTQDNCEIRRAEEKKYWESRQHRQTCWDKIHEELLNINTLGHYFVPYTPAMPTLVREDHMQSNCCKSSRAVTVMGMQGRLQTFTFQFCACEGQAVTLLRHRLWGASQAKPSVAFTLDLMTWLRALVLECQVPVKGFVEALASKMDKVNCLNISQVHNLYRSLITDSFNMFMRHHYEMSHLHIQQRAG